MQVLLDTEVPQGGHEPLQLLSLKAHHPLEPQGPELLQLVLPGCAWQCLARHFARPGQDSTEAWDIALHDVRENVEKGAAERQQVCILSVPNSPCAHTPLSLTACRRRSRASEHIIPCFTSGSSRTRLRSAGIVHKAAQRRDLQDWGVCGQYPEPVLDLQIVVSSHFSGAFRCSTRSEAPRRASLGGFRQAGPCGQHF